MDESFLSFCDGGIKSLTMDEVVVSVEQVGSLDELVVFTEELVLKASFGLFGAMKSISQSCKDGMLCLGFGISQVLSLKCMRCCNEFS